MSDPVWINKHVVLAIHNEQIAEHGGQPGIRDDALLDSALDRPRNKAAYKQSNIPTLAAAYGFGLSRNHPFLDGNKRTSLVITELFLALNGWELFANDAECLREFLALADGALSEEEFAGWLGAYASGT